MHYPDMPDMTAEHRSSHLGLPGEQQYPWSYCVAAGDGLRCLQQYPFGGSVSGQLIIGNYDR